jgi:hypothetical protein
MEQSKHTITSKPTSKPTTTKLPMKTKIAVWWIVTAGVVGTIAGETYVHRGSSDSPFPEIVALVSWIIFLFCFFYFISGIFLIVKMKSAWVVAIAFLSLGLIAFSIFYALVLLPEAYLFFPIFLLYLVPLVLIISDQKNYWKMTYRLSAKAKRSVSGEVSG